VQLALGRQNSAETKSQNTTWASGRRNWKYDMQTYASLQPPMHRRQTDAFGAAQPLTTIIYHLSNSISVHGTYSLIGYVLTCVLCLTIVVATLTHCLVSTSEFRAAAHRLLLASVLQLYYNSTSVQLQSFVPTIGVVTAFPAPITQITNDI